MADVHDRLDELTAPSPEIDAVFLRAVRRRRALRRASVLGPIGGAAVIVFAVVMARPAPMQVEPPTGPSVGPAVRTAAATPTIRILSVLNHDASELNLLEDSRPASAPIRAGASMRDHSLLDSL